jgi:2-dehydro-3-deoxyphosphogluconate aldolase/(4S)-4-hydroxy-2-oxoglutarate aldolase
MKRDEVCALIREIGIVPAIRVSSGDDAHFAAEAVTHAGIPIVEITLTVAGAVELIAHLARFHPKVIVGAGTVLNAETARQCADAGASFLTSPGFNAGVMEFAAKENLAIFPGAMTPTEVMGAWDAGSDFIKVFPCAQIGGDKYIKALHTSLPQIPLIAAGGVNQQTALNFVLSGATAIGIGSELIPHEAIARKQTKRIDELAHRFIGFVREGRLRLDAAHAASAAAKKFIETEACEGR